MQLTKTIFNSAIFIEKKWVENRLWEKSTFLWEKELIHKPLPPMRFAGLNLHRREATRSGRALSQGPWALTPPRYGPRMGPSTPADSDRVRGQAGAPEDDDHVPWSRSPWRGHSGAVTPLVTSRPGPCWASQCLGTVTPGSGPREQWEWQG